VSAAAADDANGPAAFAAFREEMNARILAEPKLLGLVASLVLRCDDCISYHIARCREAGASRDEVFETFSIGLVVGGSIVIPHLRRAVDFLQRLEQGEAVVAGVHRHAPAA